MTGVRDVLYALRMFRRAPLAGLTIVATVALGLALVAVVFTLFNGLFFRVDAVRNPGELYEVRRPPTAGARVWLPFIRPEYEALRRETTVFTDVLAMVRGIGTRVDGRTMNCALVTGNFFHVLGVRAELGRTLTPADDPRGGGDSVIVLSDSGWSRFGKDPTVVGRTVLVNGNRFEIVGVMPDGFRGLGIAAPDYWAPLSLAATFRRAYAGKEDEIPIDVIGRLKPGMSPETATIGLTVWASGRTDLKTSPGQAAHFTLKPRDGTVANDAGEVLQIFAPLFVAFGLVLMIACANVANLLLARGVSRQREIGIRLSLGAPRRRIVRQLLTESLLLALTSAACALALSQVVLEAALYAATATMPAEIAENVTFSAPGADWRVLLFLLGGAVASTAVFGLMPALHATRLELVRAMRGELTRDARPGRARDLLIAAQVGASALLLICAAVFLRSSFATAAMDSGLRTGDTVTVDVENEPLRRAIVQAVSTDPVVAGVAASRPSALAPPLSAFAKATTTSGVGYKFVSPEFFALLDIGVVQGRTFAAVERSVDAGVAVVSDTAARRLWPAGDAVGQLLQLQAASGRRDDPLQASRVYTVVGVVRDALGSRLADLPAAAVYLPTSADSEGTTLTLRVHGDPNQARQALLDRLARVDPGMRQIWLLRTMMGLETYILQVAFWVTVVLGGLALMLTVSGLFSVLSYLVEQRKQEIGVRLALGATTRDITRLVLSQLLRPVGFGLVVGGGLAAALAIVLQSAPGTAYITGFVHVFDPVAYGASVFCIVTACVLAASVPARRAATIDPIATLRQD